jgi:hypothetical protein
MCVQIYIITEKQPERKTDGLFIINRVKTAPHNFVAAVNEYISQIVCGGLCACDFYNTNPKRNHNDLLQKGIKDTNAKYKIKKLLICDDDKDDMHFADINIDKLCKELMNFNGNFI